MTIQTSIWIALSVTHGKKQRPNYDMSKKVKCPNCYGTGIVEPVPPYIDEKETCLTCKGLGNVDENELL